MNRFSRNQKIFLAVIFVIAFSISFLYVNGKRKREIVKSSIKWIESYDGIYAFRKMPGWYNSSPKAIQNVLNNFISREIVTLNLSRTSISLISSLKEFPQLRSLNVDETKISDLDFLKLNSALEELRISSTSVEDLSPLKNLPKLKTLDISDTKVTDFKIINDLSELESLGLRGLKITDCQFIFSLKKLKILEVDNSFDKHSIEEIRRSNPQLKILISP